MAVAFLSISIYVCSSAGLHVCIYVHMPLSIILGRSKERKTYRHTDRHRDIHAGIQTDIHTDKQTYRQTYRLTNINVKTRSDTARHIHTVRHTYILTDKQDKQIGRQTNIHTDRQTDSNRDRHT